MCLKTLLECVIVNLIYLRVPFLRIPFSLLFQLRVEQRRTSWELARHGKRLRQRCGASLSSSSLSSLLSPTILLAVDQLWCRDHRMMLGYGLTATHILNEKTFSLLASAPSRIHFPRGRVGDPVSLAWAST